MPMAKKVYTRVMNETNYYVRLTINVWPEIYGDERPIPFPTEQAARCFAKRNLSSTIIRARVYSPTDKLLADYDRKNYSPYNEIPTRKER